MATLIWTIGLLCLQLAGCQPPPPPPAPNSELFLDNHDSFEVSNYPPFAKKSFIIRPEGGFGKIKLSINDVLLQKQGHLCLDEIRILKEDTAGRPPCSFVPPDTVIVCDKVHLVVDSPIVTVEFCAAPYQQFHTNADYENRGFELSYKFKQNKSAIQIYNDSQVACGSVSAKYSTPGTPSLSSTTLLARHRRMVNGVETSPHSHPWTVAIFNRRASTQHKFTCTGTLLDHQFILTASHCFPNHPFDLSSYRVKLGAHQRGGIGRVNEATQMICGLQQVNISQPFDPYSNDVTIAKLDCFVPYTDEIRPVCLARAPGNLQEGGVVGTMTGWGITSLTDPVPVPKLEQVRMQVQNHAECVAKYGGRFHDTIMCAKGYEQPATFCFGDSGGPLVMESDGQWTLIGDIAFNHGCDPNKYTFFSFVPTYMSWIEKVMNERI